MMNHWIVNYLIHTIHTPIFILTLYIYSINPHPPPVWLNFVFNYEKVYFVCSLFDVLLVILNDAVSYPSFLSIVHIHVQCTLK